MKQLIIPIAIIVALIAIFVIIDRKEFRRHDNIQTVQSKSPMPNRKPSGAILQTKSGPQVSTAVETKPIKTKPIAENMPDTEPQPVETVSAKTKAAESDNAETKSAETKPVGTKQIAETRFPEVKPEDAATASNITSVEVKLKDKLIPAAVPVITAKEAERLNVEAINRMLEIQKRKNDGSVLEGQIINISQCPNPNTIDYPDCDLSATVCLNDIENTEIVLVIPCIRDSKKILSDTIQKGIYISFRIKSEDSLSEKEKSIQIVDDIMNYDLDYCYSDQILEIMNFTKITRYKKRSFKEIIYDKRLVLTKKDLVVRENYIKKELNRLNEIMANYSPDDANEFCKNFLEYTKDIGNKHLYIEYEYDDGSKKIFPIEVSYISPKQMIDSTLNNDDELIAHNANVIYSIDNYLKERGITLLVVPVPMFFESYANRFGLSKDLSTYNINRVKFMQKLLSLGVEVLDVEPLIEKYTLSPFYFFSLIEKDAHPSDMGAYYIAQEIYDHLSQYDYLETLIKNDYSLTLKDVKRKVTYDNKTFREMNSIAFTGGSPIDKSSPFLLVGDSFTTHHHFQYYLSYFLRSKINPITRSSSFPTTAPLLQMRGSEISENTKVCILVNNSYHLSIKFTPFIDDKGIQIYPNDDLNNLDLYVTYEDLVKNGFSFDLNLPDTIKQPEDYKLLFYIASNESNLSYTIEINSSQSQKLQGKFSILEYPLTAASTRLHVHCSATSDDNIVNSSSASLQISKIVLIKEKIKQMKGTSINSFFG